MSSPWVAQQSSNTSRHSIYEDAGQNLAYADNAAVSARSAIMTQPRASGNDLDLGPEPDPVYPRQERAKTRRNGQPVSKDLEASSQQVPFSRGAPLSKLMRTVAELSALVYIALSVTSVIQNNIFDGLFFGSVTSATLSMELALRGASPPNLPGDFCGGLGPNNRPVTWFLWGILYLFITNITAWAVSTHVHLKVYGIAFFLWTGFDLFLLIVAHETKAFLVDSAIVFLLFIFNVMIQYDGFKQSEETFIAFCALVVLVHLPVNVLQITYDDDCNRALRARLLPQPPDPRDEDDDLLQSSVESALSGRRIHGRDPVTPSHFPL